MNVVIPILVLSGIGAVMGIGLAIASRVFAVEEDPRVEALIDALPGANCGACGLPGCSGYAKALVQGADITECAPGGQSTVEEIARILGVEAQELAAQTALVLCAGGRKLAPDRSEYLGPMTCKSAVLVAGGSKGCRFGCVGYGDCATACDYDAVAFTDDGLAYVLDDKCIACQACVKACPRNIIRMVPKDRKVHILCSSKDPGKLTKSSCKVGCIACKLCNRRDKTTFEMDGDIARVNYEDGKDIPAAALVCTPGTIWDADVYELRPWLTDPGSREHLKKEQKAFKEAERAKKKAAKEKAAAAKAAKEKKAEEKPAEAKPDDKKAEAKPKEGGE